MKITVSIDMDDRHHKPEPDFHREIERLTRRLAHDTHRLAVAVAAAGGEYHPPYRETDMAKSAAVQPQDAATVLDALAAQITANASVVDSAVQFIGGVKGMIDAAVASALAGGATAAQLAPFTDLSAQMAAKDKALSDAILANTPVAPPAPPAP